jgi:hypothetical protein
MSPPLGPRFIKLNRERANGGPFLGVVLARVDPFAHGFAERQQLSFAHFLEFGAGLFQSTPPVEGRSPAALQVEDVFRLAAECLRACPFAETFRQGFLGDFVEREIWVIDTGARKQRCEFHLLERQFGFSFCFSPCFFLCWHRLILRNSRWKRQYAPYGVTPMVGNATDVP